MKFQIPLRELFGWTLPNPINYLISFHNLKRLVLADEEVDIVERLGFSKFGATDAKTYFEDFKEFSRFYPNHAVVEY